MANLRGAGGPLLDWKLVLLRQAVAVAIGLTLGWERETKRKPAGLKTISLVSLGSCTFVLVALEFVAGMDQEEQLLRILEGLIGGVGFLGAGAIIQSRGNVQGLTTAAGLWVAASLGVASGLGYFQIAGLGTLSALLVLRVIGPLGHKAVDEVVEDGRGESEGD